MTLLPVLVALALGAPPVDDPLVLEGVVHAPDGTPARGAVVRLAARSESRQRIYAELYESVETDDGGRFRVVVPEAWLARPGWKELFLVARAEAAGLLGVRIDAKEMPVGTDVVLRLGPPRSTRVVVLDPAGEPVEGATVTAASVPGSQDVSVLFTADLAREIAGTTDASGVATITGVSAERVGALVVESDAHGTQVFHADFGRAGWLAEEAAVTLQPTTRLTFEWAGDEEAPISAADVDLRTWVPLGETDPNERFVMSYASARVGPGVPPVEVVVAAGSPVIEVRGDDPSVLGLTLERPELEPGGTGRLSLGPADTLVAVSGRFVDENGQGVGPVRALVDGEIRAWIEADEDGRFTVAVRPPMFLLREARAPAGLSGFTRDDGARQWPIPEGEAAFDVGPIELAHSTPIRGFVRRPDGTPVPGAWVSGEVEVSDGRMITSTYSWALADAEGWFVLEGVGPDEVAELRSHYAGWFSLEASRVSAAGGEQVELRIRELLAPHGTVVDGAGQPIVGTTVEIWASSPENVIGGERPVAFGTEKRLRVGADGTFTGTPALAPEGRYCAVLRSKRAELRRTEWFTGAHAAAGLAFEMRRLRTLRGRIVDGDGAPVAGARVMVRGGNPEQVRATTDAAGRFELDRVTPDAGFVFAKTKDGGFHGIRFEATGDLAWRIGPRSREAAPSDPEPAAPREVELEVARRLLARGVDEAFEGDQEHEHLRSLQRMAWVDPAYVLDQLERGVLKSSWVSMVHSQVVQSLADESPDEAQAVAEMIESSYSSAMATIYVADALPAEEHDRKLELLALALAKTKQIQGPAHQLILYSWVAERLLDLGEVEQAKDVFAQAIPIADDIPADEWSGFARSSFAEELAQVDLAAALVYVDEYTSTGDRGRHYGNIAQELAASDPHTAEELLGKLKQGSWRPERYAPAICYEMAPVDLERARRIADRHDPSGWSLGMMALALADHDPEEALRLLVAAYARLEEHAESGKQTVWNRSPAKIGAALLPVVVRIAPDDLESYVWRALALRKVKPDLRYLSTADSVMAADGALAFYVARYDRSLARTLLEPVVRHLATLEDDRGGDWGAVYAALAVIDPTWAAELAETTLPPGGAKVIGAVLARDPKDRTDYVQEEHLNLWILGKEDI